MSEKVKMITHSEFLKKLQLFVNESKNDLRFPFFLYSVIAVLLMISKGPIYFLTTLFISLCILTFYYKNLSIAALQMYLLSILIGGPAFFTFFGDQSDAQRKPTL